eukprot:jgi/Mesvir1/1753/Mv11890-RA.1
MSIFLDNPHSSQEMTLERVMAFPGIGAQVMNLLPIPDRVRLRRTGGTFLSAVDESLQGVTELFGEDIAGEGCSSGTRGLSWLLTKCPNLRTLSMDSRDEHGAPWGERKRLSLRWPWEGSPWGAHIRSDVVRLDHLSRSCHELRSLNVAGCKDVTEASLMEVVNRCPRLTSLDISGCKLENTSIKAVARSCPGLVHLSFNACYLITDDSLISLGRCCRQLETLEAAHTEVTDSGVAVLVRNCPLLRRVALPRVTDASMGLVAEHCPQLEWLDVPDERHGVTDVGLKLIAASCPRIHRVVIAHHVWEKSQITDASISALAEGCRGLRHLAVRGAGVSDASVVAVASNCTGLEYLDVSGCKNVTDASVDQLAVMCPRLRHLAVRKCDRVSDASICRILAECKELKELDVNDSGVTDVGIREVASRCRDLEQLDISNCQVSCATLVALAQACPKLVCLHVTACGGGVTAESLAAISRHCTRLADFGAAKNNLHDRDVAPLIEGRGRGLRVLDLGENPVGDDTITLLVEKCPGLLELRLSWTKVRGPKTYIADWSFDPLVEGCVGLRRLEAIRSSKGQTLCSLVKNRCHVMWFHPSTKPHLLRGRGKFGTHMVVVQSRTSQ